jgi:hypothetical protein
VGREERGLFLPLARRNISGHSEIIARFNVLYFFSLVLFQVTRDNGKISGEQGGGKGEEK